MEKTVPLKTLYDEARKKYPVRLGKPHKRRSVKTGFRNVFLVPCSSCRQGFMFQYRWLDEMGQTRIVSSINLNRLKDKMDEKGFVLEISDENLANQTMNKFGGILW